MLQKALFIAALLADILPGIQAWVAPAVSRTRQARRRVTSPFRTASDATTDADLLGGVAEFDAWFTASPDAFCRPAIQHKDFGSRLRGLTYTDAHEIKEPTTVLSVPREFILKAPYSDPDWDVQLAQQLWDECQKGQKSEIHGYCALLARGTPFPISDSSCPPSTAPNALRRWSEEERSMLESTASGRKLLDLQSAQQQQWRNKFSKVRNMSWEQFEWAMEAVHSRAFRGNFSSGGAFQVASLAAPVAAALGGWTYLQGNSDPSDVVLLGLAVIGATPLLLDTLSNKEGDAVLLPLIDSANHSEDADSSIEYDPLKGTISLNIGPKCLVEEDGGETQMYVSYGPKTDAELLLNYGFLPGVPGSEIPEVEQRRLLVEAFMRRNPQ